MGTAPANTTDPSGPASVVAGARTSGLLDLSDEDCRSMLTELVSGLIDQYEIGIYREDFNISPLDFWQIDDPDERKGATENHYLQGHLAFWDELLDRHPGLMIDSCASGGRRNDLETMRRSVPLHYSDYGYGLHPVKVDFQRTLFEWLPYFKETLPLMGRCRRPRPGPRRLGAR